VQASQSSPSIQGADDRETPPKVDLVRSHHGPDTRPGTPSETIPGVGDCLPHSRGDLRQGVPTPQGRGFGTDLMSSLQHSRRTLQQLQARIEGGARRCSLGHTSGSRATRGVSLQASEEPPSIASSVLRMGGWTPCGDSREAGGFPAGAPETAEAAAPAAMSVSLPEFSVTSPFLGAAAAGQSLRGLSKPLQHALGFLRTVAAPPVVRAGHGRAVLPAAVASLAHRPTLVLDLDETLVHCHRGPGRACWAQAPPGSGRGDGALPLGVVAPATDLVVEFDDVPRGAAGAVAFRPGVRQFLEAASRSFEVVVFTASVQLYADKVIDALDPSGCCVAHRLYREHCTEHRGAFFKNLGLLGRPLAKCILVDNSPISVACNVDNGILCRSWFGDPGDRELVDLLDLLEAFRASGVDADRFLADRYGLRSFFEALRSAEPERPPPPP